MEDKRPLRHQPFGALMHSGFQEPEQNKQAHRDKQGGGKNRHKNQKNKQHQQQGRKEAKPMPAHQAQEIASEVERGHGHTVPEQRKHAQAEAERHPQTQSHDRELSTLVNALIDQNSSTIGAMMSILKKQDETMGRFMENQHGLLSGIRASLEVQNSLGQKQLELAESQAAFFENVGNEMKKARKGKKSLFRHSTWERVEDGAYDVGKIAVGGAIGFGAVQLATIGVKALFGQ